MIVFYFSSQWDGIEAFLYPLFLKLVSNIVHIIGLHDLIPRYLICPRYECFVHDA
jgi:hypothetical protein